MSAERLISWKTPAMLVSLVLGSMGLWSCVEVPSNGTNGTGQPDASAIRINVQIDAEREDTEGITRIVDELKARGISTTIFVTADYANANALLVHDFFLDGFEIALHGFSTGEQLASMTYDDQKDLLERAMLALNGCEPCGTYKPITGFRPQYFSQNEDTYRILDEIGLTYDCGFKAGQIFIEGHEQDVTPYPVTGHDFSAVPLTTIEYEGKVIYLCDIACAFVDEMTADQWAEALSIGLAQCVERQEPMALIFHGWYTGDTEQYDYWQPFVDFLDEAASTGVFVGTQEFVDYYSD